MKNLKKYLFSLFVFGCIHIACAQEYKYFDVVSSNEFRIRLSPKELIGFRDRAEERINSNMDAFQIKLDQTFYDIYTPIFNEVFGFPFEGDPRLLSKINIAFRFGKDFKPYYFSISFPTDRMNEFPGLEEKIYRFGKRCMQTNFKTFVKVYNNEEFNGSSFMISLYGFYLYSEGKIKIFP